LSHNIQNVDTLLMVTKVYMQIIFQINFFLEFCPMYCLVGTN